MSIKTNTASLQNLLDAVNNLPDAGVAENLDAEMSTQSTLLSEQDAKIAQLAEILSGKASGSGSSGGGVELESVSVEVPGAADPMSMIYYVDNTITLCIKEIAPRGVYTVLKGSILITTDYTNILTNCQQLAGNSMCKAFLVTG